MSDRAAVAGSLLTDGTGRQDLLDLLRLRPATEAPALFEPGVELFWDDPHIASSGDH